MTWPKNTAMVPDRGLLKEALGGILRTAAPKILLWGPELRTFCNEPYVQLDPHARCAKGGENFQSVLPHVWRQVSEALTGASKGVERLSAEVTVDLGSFEPSTTLCFTAYFTPLYGSENRPRGVLIDIHEFTDDRSLSQRLMVENRHWQQLFSEAPVMIAYARGSDFRVQFANTAFRKFYGFRPLEGLTVGEAIPEAVEQGFESLLTNVLTSGVPFEGTEMPIMVRHGAEEQLQYVDFTYQPVRDSSGHPIGILCAGVDVTEKRKAQEESDNFRHQILHASRVNAMGTMAMTLAHEISQPLAAAAGYLSAAQIVGNNRELRDDALLLESLDLGIKQVRRAGMIIKRIQPVVRAGEADRRDVSMSAAVENALALLSVEHEFDLIVSKCILRELDVVLADAIQLEQVLVNLLRNAAQASRHAERREVIIATERLGEGCLRTSLRDFGTGISLSQLPGLFEFGGRASDGGLGIGLVLCRTLIEANGGFISGRNAPDGGAIFLLDLERPARDDTFQSRSVKS